MGVQIGEIIEKEHITLEMLSGRKIAIDAFNSLYQFLSIIRQPDGTPLMDSKGRITSHLSGLLYRTGKLVEANILPCYVFDGKPPEFKSHTVGERKKIREEAKKKWEEALEKGDVEEARIYAQAALSLTDEMVEDAKKLLNGLGIPWVQAPSEGEAQAAYMARKGDVWASASQDYDSLLFGSPILIRNLTITGKRKLPRKNVYVEVVPEKIELNKVLQKLGIDREKLIEIGLMIGTDFNEGVKGVGPKKALDFVKKGLSAVDVYRQYGVEQDVDLEQLKAFFLNPPISDDYELNWHEPDKETVLKLLVDEHDFSQDRVEKVVDMMKEKLKMRQSTLTSWFG